MATAKTLLPPRALARRLARLRRGKKVVFTNGVFDLFHAGHLKILRFAKRHGKILIVALNSDASTRRLKGPKRPILPLKDRGELIASLDPVDFVTYFNEDTPHNLIKTLRPDVLVKGGDWSPNKIIGREFVKKVVRVPLMKGRSSTGIIKTIAKRYGRR